MYCFPALWVVATYVDRYIYSQMLAVYVCIFCYTILLRWSYTGFFRCSYIGIFVCLLGTDKFNIRKYFSVYTAIGMCHGENNVIV